MSTAPIAEHALLSDCHTAALVRRDGSVEWLCWPRFDAASIFGRILDEGAGHWRIGPTAEPIEITRRYLGRTLVLETTFRTSTGSIALIEALATGPNEGGHDLGTHSPRALLRKVRGLEGSVEVEVDVQPRPEYGLTVPLVHSSAGGLVARGGPLLLGISSPWPFELFEGGGRAVGTVEAGDEVGFCLQARPTEEHEVALTTQEDMERSLEETIQAWQSWSHQHANYEGAWQDLVDLSGRVLQGLTYQPTGAVVAAPTTSLPEEVGGERNWDYRYAWIRDASLTLEALWVAACPDEAHAFFAWLVRTAGTEVHNEQPLQIMFGVGGEHDLSERELDHLSGWRGSRPVRVGNDAWDQAQLDVYGELLGAAHRLRDAIEIGHDTRGLLVALAETARQRWREADQGIWEVRSGPQHFVYSKLMCWTAIDRAIDMLEALDAQARLADWQATADEIREQLLTRGWNEEVGAFTQAFDSPVLDASALMIPIVGFLPAEDERVRSTIAAIEEHLTDDRGLVYRYLDAEDGVEGGEGSFLLCTFWLAHAHALAGDTTRARAVFERAASYVNDVGLLSEEVDSATGELLGNFPQAFSHIGLVNAAWAITRAEES